MKYFERNKNKNTTFKNLKKKKQKTKRYSKISSKREFQSEKGLPQEMRKILNNLNYHLKKLEK